MDNSGDYISREAAIEALEQNWNPDTEAELRIFSTNCKNTVTTGEDREISNLRAWLKNGQEKK